MSPPLPIHNSSLICFSHWTQAQTCVLMPTGGIPWYSKTYLKQPLKRKTENWFSRPINTLCRSKVLQNAPREHSAILLTCIKLPFVFKIFVLSIFEWLLKHQGILWWYIYFGGTQLYHCLWSIISNLIQRLIVHFILSKKNDTASLIFIFSTHVINVWHNSWLIFCIWEKPKQWRPRWNAALCKIATGSTLCGISSGSSPFVEVKQIFKQKKTIFLIIITWHP